MTTRKKGNGPPKSPQENGKGERLTLEEFKRQVEKAQKHGEPIDALVERLVVSTIDAVSEKINKDDEPGSSD